jgi:hypothetical protein
LPYVFSAPDRALEIQSAFAGGVRQSLDAAVIEILAAVEHHILDARGGGTLGDELADRFGGTDVGTGLEGRRSPGHRCAWRTETRSSAVVFLRRPP